MSTDWQRWQAPRMRSGESAAVMVGKNRENAPVLTPAELERLRAQAREQGFQQGFAEGQAAAASALVQERERLQAVLDELARPLRQVSRQVGEELTLLALSIARQVLRRELSQQPEQVVAIVQEALAALPSGAHDIRVHLHPEDLKRVQKVLGRGQAEGWTLQEDASLRPGGCLLTSDMARVDERVETRLERVVARLFGEAVTSDGVDV